jgi:hypothetical protein
MLNCTFVQYLLASGDVRGKTASADAAVPGTPASLASSTRLAQISTKTVYKVVEKYPLDMPKPSRNAGFNNLPVAWANLNLHKINELRSQVMHESKKYTRCNQARMCTTVELALPAP